MNKGRKVSPIEVDNVSAIDTIGGRIAYVRTNRGMTQEELGNIIIVSREKIVKIEKGERAIKAEELRAIAKALEISADFLLCLTNIRESDIDKQKIEALLGLSGPAQSWLKTWKEIEDDELKLIDEFIVSMEIGDISRLMYKWLHSKNLEAIYEEFVQGISPSLNETGVTSETDFSLLNRLRDEERASIQKETIDNPLTLEEEKIALVIDKRLDIEKEQTIQKAYRFEMIEAFSKFLDNFLEIAKFSFRAKIEEGLTDAKEAK